MNRKQKVALNSQSSSRSSTNAEAPQFLILGPLFFLIYANHLLKRFSSDVKLFAAILQFFLVVFDVKESTTDMNNNHKVY